MIIGTKKSLLIVLCIAFFSIAFLSVSAQDNFDDTTDFIDDENFFEDIESPVFIEIILDKGRVSAIDTMGYDWYYDFDLDSFVEGYYPDGEFADDKLIADEILSVNERCTIEKKVKDYGGDVIVGYDEYVDDEIKVFERVSIKGWVRGDVTSYYDSVIIYRSGQVDGDVKAPWVIQKKGSTVLGEIKIIKDASLDFKDITGSFSTDGLVIAIIFTVVLIFFSFLVTNLMPVQLKRMNEVVLNSPVKSYLLGFLIILLMPIVIISVIITIVGIIVVVFVPVLYLLAFFMGIVIFGNRIGRIISIRFLGGEKKMMFQSTMGVFLFMSLWLLDAILLGQQGDVAEGFGIFVLVVAIIVSTFPICTGIGAALLTRFGFRDYRSWKNLHGFGSEPPAPAPPPLREQDDDDLNNESSTTNPDSPNKPKPPNNSGEPF